MRIDFHTHFHCLDFIRHLQGRSSFPTSTLREGSYVVQCTTGLDVPSIPKIIDVQEKLREMENMGIDVAVLSHGIPFGPDLLGGQEADELASRINDDLARIISNYPRRLVGLGTIGFGDPRRSIVEVHRCVEQLGFRGFQIFSNISGKLLDSYEVMTVLRHIGTLDVPIHLHPAIPLNRVGLDTPGNFLSLGFPYDSSLNVLRLIQAGLFDESPNLKLIVAHVGGVIPYLAGRIGTYSARSALVPEATHLAHPLDHYRNHARTQIIKYQISTGRTTILIDYATDGHHFTSTTKGGTGDLSADDWAAFRADNEQQVCAVDLTLIRTYCTDYTAPNPNSRAGWDFVDYVQHK